jgi:uncharacterized protein YgiM (DUF1202 family)
MSTNYNNFFNSNVNNQVDDEVKVGEVETETVEETIKTDDIEETIVTKPIKEDPKVLYGINNTKKLNVRTEPNKDADILCVIDSKSTFEIEELESDPEWVKVFLDNGKVGFCMKMYVAIK